MNIEKAIGIICAAKCIKSGQNVEKMGYSLDRYLAHVYTNTKCAQDWPEFVAQFLLENYDTMVKHGWDETCHMVCNDMSTNNDTLFLI